MGENEIEKKIKDAIRTGRGCPRCGANMSPIGPEGIAGLKCLECGYWKEVNTVEAEQAAD